MSKKRQNYDKAFRQEAAKMVLEQGLNCREVAQSLGVSASSVASWVKQFAEYGKDAFPGNGKLMPKDEELRQLKADVKRLQMENEFLKKTAAFFAKEMS